MLVLTAVLGSAAVLPARAHDLEITHSMLAWNGTPRTDHAASVPATLGNICDLMHQRDPDANFALAPGLGDVVVADLKLDGANMEQQLDALRIASGSQFAWRNARQDRPGIDPATGLPIASSAASGPQLYVLTPAMAPGLQVEAFSIGRYLAAGGEAYNAAPDKSGESPEARAKRQEEQVAQIKMMVDETMGQYQQMLNESRVPGMANLPHPVIKFHPGANLLVVIGDPRVVTIAAKVICALPGVQRSGASGLPVANPFGMSGLPGATTLAPVADVSRTSQDAFYPNPVPAAPETRTLPSADVSTAPAETAPAALPARRF